MTYPKILFLADEIPQSKNAGSIQFLRIFADYPSKNLLVVGRKISPNATTLSCKYIALKFAFADRLRTTRFHRLLPILETLGLVNYHVSKEIKQEIDAFKPDIVVSIMQLYMYYSSAYNYAKSHQLPLYIFCHDDVEEFSNIPDFLKKRLIEKNAIIYKYALQRLCISPQMAKTWEQKYGSSGIVIYPIPDKNLKPRHINISRNILDNEKLTIGFAGSMAYGYAEGISEILPIMVNTNSIFKVYNEPSKILHENISTNIKFCGYAPTALETWERIKNECDAIILPYSFQIKYKKLYQTHFPSKLSEYLTLGMPVIIIGPEYATGVIWGLEHPEAVLTSTDASLQDLAIMIKKLANNADFRQKYSQNAIKYAEEFAPEKVKKQFYDLLLNHIA